MHKSKTKYLLFLILFVYSFILQAQNPYITCRNCAKISKENLFTNDTIYIKTKLSSSDFFITIMLVNNSHDNIVLKGYNSKLSFSKQAINGNNTWATIDKSRTTCGTGYYNFVLPPYSYTWEKIPKSYFLNGHFDTQVRFYSGYNDTMIYSMPIKAKIDSTWFSGNPMFLLSNLTRTIHGFS